MKALILAAGIGSRLGLQNIPKPMYEVDGKPVLEHNILLLRKYGVKEIYINVHHMAETIKSYVGDGSKWGVRVKYSYEKELLGTSGAVKNLEQNLGTDPFFVVYGDNYSNVNLSKMLEEHKLSSPLATIAVFDPKTVVNSGIAGGVIVIDDKNNLLSFNEGEGNKIKGYVNAGVYVLEHGIFDIIPKDKLSDFGKDIFPKLLQTKTTLKAYITDGYVLGFDTKEALSSTEALIKQGEISNDTN